MGCFIIKKFEYKFRYTRKQLIDILNNFVFDVDKKEKEIFELLIKGYNCEQIADATNLSTSTIKRRRASLFNSLDKFLQQDGELNINNIKTGNVNRIADYSVYILIFPNHKMYVGQTQNTKQRWNNGNGYKDNPKMHRDIMKYGWSNILKVVPYTNLSYKQSITIERELTLLYKTYNRKYGYNRRIGTGAKHD